MAENSNQPREYDAILGGQAPPPVDSVVLGGLEGVKRRLASPVIEQRIAALVDAPKYKRAGLDLVIEALQDESEQVQNAAYSLLWERRRQPRIKQALRDRNPWLLFECLYTIKGNSSSLVVSVAISSDGQTLIGGSGCLDGSGCYRNYHINIWNLRSKQEISTLIGHSNSVLSLALSLDGQTLISGSGNRSIKVWDLHTKQAIRTLEGHREGIRAVAISSDGKTIISGSEDGTIKVWDLQTGQAINTLIAHSRCWVRCVAISPDGQTIISGGRDNKIKVWDLHTGQEIRTFTGHLGSVFCAAISPDGHDSRVLPGLDVLSDEEKASFTNAIKSLETFSIEQPLASNIQKINIDKPLYLLHLDPSLRITFEVIEENKIKIQDLFRREMIEYLFSKKS